MLPLVPYQKHYPELQVFIQPVECYGYELVSGVSPFSTVLYESYESLCDLSSLHTLVVVWLPCLYGTNRPLSVKSS